LCVHNPETQKYNSFPNFKQDFDQSGFGCGEIKKAPPKWQGVYLFTFPKTLKSASYKKSPDKIKAL
jgi:hypothetical protein